AHLPSFCNYFGCWPGPEVCRAALDGGLGSCVDGSGLSRVLLHVAALVVAAMCSAFERGSTGPLAIMPSADQVPVKSSHSTMLWPKWVVLITGIDRIWVTCCQSFPAFTSRRYRRDLVRSRLALASQRDGFPVALALGHHRPGHARNLVGERDRGHLRRPPFQQLGKPWSMLAAVDFRVSDHRKRASAEQRAQVSITLFGDIAEPLPASTGVLLRYEPNPG